MGQRLLDELRKRGLDTQYLQTDPDHRTGRVDVKRQPDGSHSFRIAGNAAYDWLQYDPDLDTLAQSADAVCFGTLAQRNTQSRFTIRRFLEQAHHAIRLFDVNLRQNNDAERFYSRDQLQHGCEAATIVKLNEEELPLVADLLRITKPGQSAPGSAAPAGQIARALQEYYHLDAVILTRGKDGTAAQTADGFIEGTPADAERHSEGDTVGAGDACTAALLVARLLNHDWPTALDFANRVASYVAHQPGATPTLPDAIIQFLPT
jgi:fructokinase